ncbi:MAG: cellulose binding domain-containing protein [Labedaea sp.]
MRDKLTHALAGVVVAGSVIVAVQGAAQTAPAAAGIAAASEQYNWRNVQIAGGGYVPSIVFNPTERNLIYARTDIGGAYRWNESTQRWTPLLDFVGWNNWGFNGVSSIATDPVQTNRVYVAAGMYTNSFDPNNGAILRSADKGATWQITNLPFKLGGNMPGRGMGERLAVDPNRNSTVYFGAPNGNGLWRSTDFGATWAKVANFPNVGNYAQDPSDPSGYLSHQPGVVWVSFDKSTGTSGNATQGIYVGVADKNNTVYRSTNGGTSWERIAGQPTGFLAHKGVLDPVNHVLYIATSDTGGPYDGAKGDVWKYNIATGAWTQISPIPSSSADDYFGYGGLTIDRQNPNTIMVATQISWWPDAIFFRSTNGGATWTRIWDFTSYPNRSFRYTQDVSSSPWLTFGTNPQLPEVTPKLGWMNDGVEIDPFNSNRMMYGTGATLYGTTNLSNWDSGGQFTIKPMAAGLEETAVLDLISPPAGAPLISGLGDIGGFRHTNLDAVPATMFTAPNFTSTTSLDYAERTPSVMVWAGNFTDSDRPNDSHVAFSTDGGANWFQGSEPGGINEGGTVAAAADGSRFVWAPGGGMQPVFSVGFGNSWTQAQGLPPGSVVESDRVNASKFYGLSGGRLFVSTNGGANFTATSASGLPTGKFKAMPGREGDLWVAGDTGLFHSTDSGATFTKLSNVASAHSIGFGAAAPGRTNLALFTMATIDGVSGVYRSDDTGATWVRINDDAHQYGNAGDAITGDPRVYGRVYLGTNGRGILYADRIGGNTTTTSTTTSTTTTRTTTTTTTPTSTTTTSTTTTTRPPGNCRVTYRVNQWDSGFTANLTLANTGTAAINGWTLAFSFPASQRVVSGWNANWDQVVGGTNVTASNVDFNGSIAPGTSIEIGFNGSWAGSNPSPSNFTVNNNQCSSG